MPDEFESSFAATTTIEFTKHWMLGRAKKHMERNRKSKWVPEIAAIRGSEHIAQFCSRHYAPSERANIFACMGIFLALHGADSYVVFVDTELETPDGTAQEGVLCITQKKGEETDISIYPYTRLYDDAVDWLEPVTGLGKEVHEELVNALEYGLNLQEVNDVMEEEGLKNHALAWLEDQGHQLMTNSSSTLGYWTGRNNRPLFKPFGGSEW